MRQPTHPGEILREDILPELNISKSEFARRAHISRQTLYRILDGKEPIRVATALKLAKLLNNNAEFWLNMQSKYDVWQSTISLKDELDQIECLTANG